MTPLDSVSNTGKTERSGTAVSRSSKVSAVSSARIKAAHKESDAIKKDKILQAKERFIELKSEHEKVGSYKMNLIVKIFQCAQHTHIYMQLYCFCVSAEHDV